MISRLVRASLAGIALVALLVGVPMLLVLYGRSPLDGAGSLVDQITALPTQAISDNMAFGLLTITAWIAWVTFAQNVVVELGHAIGPATRLRPLGWSPFQTTARQLVTALTMTVSLSTSLSARAGGLPPLRPAQVEQPAETPTPGVSGSVALADSSARTAERHGPVEPNPATPLTTVSIATTYEIPPALPTAEVAPAPDAGIFTVAAGDSPWAIAEAHLGGGFRWRELWELNRGVPQPDGRAWVVEDLIRPGWRLALPVPAGAAAASSPTVEDQSPDPAESPSTTCVSNPEPDIEVNEPTDAGPVAPAPTTTTTIAPTAETEAEHPPKSGPELPSPAGDSGPFPDLAPPLAGVTGATVAATSIALALHRRRRRRSVRTARNWRQPGSTPAEAAISAAADVPLVRWAGQELAAALHGAHPDVLGEATPIAVEISATRGIELLWDRPVVYVAPPWTARDDGWAWSLPYDPDSQVPSDQRTSPIPALVTVGDREGRQLMLDLEALGSVSVVGDPDSVNDFGRAIALELGADEDLADAYVSIVGIDLDTAQQLNRVVEAAPDEALAKLRSTVSAVSDSLRDSDRNTTFSYRIDDDDSYLEATVVVVDVRSRPDLAQPFVEASPTHRGVATVFLGEVPNARATITLRPDGLARIDPLGIAFGAATVPEATDLQIGELLRGERERSHDDMEQGAVATSVSEQRANGATTRDAFADSGPRGSAETDVAQGVEPAESLLSRFGDLAQPIEVPGLVETDLDTPTIDVSDSAMADQSMIVRVLGTPTVPARPSLHRRELVLTVYMACRARPVTPSSIQNAVWGGRAVEPKTLWNVVARTRTALGAFPDGTPVMPPNDRKGGTLRLSDRVVTDLALLQACYSQALQLPSSEAIHLLSRGLGLVEGEPFNAVGYEWAYRDDQFVAQASTLIENAAEHLVGLATAADNLDTAREAITLGLRGLPGDEVLYRSRMRLEHAAGNIAGVETAWKELSDFLLDLDVEPSEATAALYTQLTRRR